MSPNPPRFATLEQWLRWQQALHPKSIDLGLERLLRVMTRLGIERPLYRIITVGGTNGKGSSVALLEAILRAAGYRVGAYTSPHLLRYGERIRVDGMAVSDAQLCRAFARIDAGRGDTSLTYFEFGTLAAFDIFRQLAIDVAVLEVGLGGRLDAVNAVDADAALITNVDIDHVEWLGPDRETIGYEKAWIYRGGRPAICGDSAPPRSLLAYAHAIGARLCRYTKDYGFQVEAQCWHWWHGTARLESLPLPSLLGNHQLANAAAVLTTLQALSATLPVDSAAIRRGLIQANLPGRFQIIPGPIEWILDVAHNPLSAMTLASCLRQRPCHGRTLAVVGMLVDKDVAAVARVLAGVVDRWYAATVSNPRGYSGAQLAEVLRTAGIVCDYFASVVQACGAAARAASPGDRIVVFGSFYTVAAVLKVGLKEVMTSG